MAKTYGPYLDLIIGADLGEEWFDELKKFLRFANALMGMPYIGTGIVYDPPATPADGQCCLLGSAYEGTLTGDFAGHSNEVAIWNDDASVWEFIVPTFQMKVGANVYTGDVTDPRTPGAAAGWNNVYYEEVP